MLLRGFGAKGLSSPDWAWKQRKFEAALEGVEAKRTPEWGVRKPLQAAFDLAVGLFALAAGLKMLPPSGPPEDPAQREVALAKARRENPVEWVKQEMDDRINRYRRGEDFALPFLSSRATNISLGRVIRSGEPNLSSANALLLDNTNVPSVVAVSGGQ